MCVQVRHSLAVRALLSVLPTPLAALCKSMQLTGRGAYGMAGTHIGKVVVAMAPTHDTTATPEQAQNQDALAPTPGHPTMATLAGPVRRPAQANLAAAYEYVEQPQAVGQHKTPIHNANSRCGDFRFGGKDRARREYRLCHS